MKNLNNYIIEKLHLNKDIKIEDKSPLQEISNIINDYFRNILKLDTTKYIYLLDKGGSNSAKNIDELKRIYIYSKEFNQKYDIDKISEELFEKINKIYKLDKNLTEIYSTVIIFYPDKRYYENT